MGQSHNSESWTDPIEVSPSVFEVFQEAIRYLSDNEQVYISTWREMTTISSPIVDRIGGLAATDVVQVRFWAPTLEDMKRFKELIKGIGISSRN